MSKKKIINNWLTLFYTLVVLFALVPFIRVDFSRTYDVTVVLWFLVIIYLVVTLWGTCNIIRTLFNMKKGNELKNIIKFIFIRLYYVVFWPITFLYGSIKATYIVFKRSAGKI